jgi:hypothetical protein
VLPGVVDVVASVACGAVAARCPRWRARGFAQLSFLANLWSGVRVAVAGRCVELFVSLSAKIVVVVVLKRVAACLLR